MTESINTENINMEEKMKELLPVGTVVITRMSKKKIIIIGTFQIQSEKHQVYDYMGVFYPEGFIGLEGCVLFQHQDIQEVIFKGYEDREREVFIEFFSSAFLAAVEQAES